LVLGWEQELVLVMVLMWEQK
jgi:hypothetical protein